MPYSPVRVIDGGMVMRLLAALFLLLVLAAPANAEPQAGDEHFGSPCRYPESALAAHTEGMTQVFYTGTRDGHIREVNVARSSGDKDLDEASIRCVTRWRFDPTVEKWVMGHHTTYIAWSIPKASAGSQSNQPMGTFIGVPHQCMDQYPLAEMKAHIEGTVVVDFTITAEGRVRDVHVAESAGNANLDAAAVNCVTRWRYNPARDADGKPVAVQNRAKIEWKTRENPLPLPKFAEPPPDCLHLYPVKPEDLTGGDGITEVGYTILSSGEVDDAAVARSSGNKRLDRAAVECISKRKYQPLTADLGNGQKMSWKLKMREQVKWSDAIKSDK